MDRIAYLGGRLCGDGGSSNDAQRRIHAAAIAAATSAAATTARKTLEDVKAVGRVKRTCWNSAWCQFLSLWVGNTNFDIETGGEATGCMDQLGDVIST